MAETIFNAVAGDKVNKNNMVYGSYTFTSQTDLETQLVNLASDIGPRTSIVIWLYPNYSSLIFGGAPGYATIVIGTTTSYFSVSFHNYVAAVHGTYINGTWSWQQLATKNTVASLSTPTQLGISAGIPQSSTLSLSETYYNYALILIEILQYGNVWASMIVSSDYFEGTDYGRRPQIRGFESDNVIEIYKNTRTQVQILHAGSTDLSNSSIYHVKISGLFKRT